MEEKKNIVQKKKCTCLADWHKKINENAHGNHHNIHYKNSYIE